MSESVADVSGQHLPVTVVLARRPAPGREDQLVTWAHDITAAAAAFPGHLGAQIYPPAGDNPDVVVAFTFASSHELSTWEHSPERQEWIARAQPLVQGEARAHGVSGFEGIFSHSPGQAVLPPPRWKTASIIALALFPMSLLVSWVLGPHTAGWNIVARVALNVAIIVPYMAWVGVPYLTRWLKPWLHP